VPMMDLKNELEKHGLKKIVTILNSGNVLFEKADTDTEQLEEEITAVLESRFQFSIPTIVCEASHIQALFETNPFKEIKTTSDTRLYISFLKKAPVIDLTLPWTSPDQSYSILKQENKIVLSHLDLSITHTPKAMEAFDKFYGKENTTRNWNTIERIVKKLD